MDKLGNVLEDHTVNNIAFTLGVPQTLNIPTTCPQTFSVQDPSVCGGVEDSKGTMTASVLPVRYSLLDAKKSPYGTMSVDIYIFKTNGTIQWNKETIRMRSDQFKFSVTLSDYAFCGSDKATCKKETVGVAVQYQLAMQSTGNKNKFAPKVKKSFEFESSGDRVTFLGGYMMTTSNGTQWGTLQIDADTSGANTVTSITAQGPFTAMRADPIVVVGMEGADDSGGSGMPTTAPDGAPKNEEDKDPQIYVVLYVGFIVCLFISIIGHFLISKKLEDLEKSIRESNLPDGNTQEVHLLEGQEEEMDGPGLSGVTSTVTSRRGSSEQLDG